jgi:hypothetical protein
MRFNVLTVMMIWVSSLCSHAFLSHQPTKRSFSRPTILQIGTLEERHRNNDSSSPSTESSSNTARHTHPLTKLLGRSHASTASTVATTAAVTAAGATAVAVTAKVASSTVAASSSPSSAFLGGALSGFVEKLFISPAKFWCVLKAVGAFALQDYKDWLLIALCIYGPIPLSKRYYFWRHRHLQLDRPPMEQKFKFSKTRKAAQIIAEIGNLFGLLFGTELFLIFLKELGFKVVTSSAHTWATGVVATLWMAKIVSDFKKYLLSRANSKDLSQAAGARMINRFLDIIIVFATTLAILDFLSVKTGFALQSLLGFSSIGTLVFSLASQNLASEFLASLAIQGTNMYVFRMGRIDYSVELGKLGLKPLSSTSISVLCVLS